MGDGFIAPTKHCKVPCRKQYVGNSDILDYFNLFTTKSATVSSMIFFVCLGSSLFLSIGKNGRAGIKIPLPKALFVPNWCVKPYLKPFFWMLFDTVTLSLVASTTHQSARSPSSLSIFLLPPAPSLFRNDFVWRFLLLIKALLPWLLKAVFADSGFHRSPNGLVSLSKLRFISFDRILPMLFISGLVFVLRDRKVSRFLITLSKPLISIDIGCPLWYSDFEVKLEMPSDLAEGRS